MNTKAQACLSVQDAPLGNTVRLQELHPVHHVLLEHTVLLELLPVHRVVLEKNLMPLGRAVVSRHYI